MRAGNAAKEKASNYGALLKRTLRRLDGNARSSVRGAAAEEESGPGARAAPSPGPVALCPGGQLSAGAALPSPTRTPGAAPSPLRPDADGAQCRRAAAAGPGAAALAGPAPRHCRAAAALCRTPAAWRSARAPRRSCGSPGRSAAERGGRQAPGVASGHAAARGGLRAVPGRAGAHRPGRWGRKWRSKGILGILQGPGSGGGGGISSACVLAYFLACLNRFSL